MKRGNWPARIRSAAGRMRAFAQRHALVILIGAAAAALYLPSLGNPFVYDDSINIVKNPSIRRLANLPRFFTEIETTTSNESFELVYRPLSTVSYALDYALGGLKPRGYILHNVVLHALAAGLCAGAMRALTGSPWLAAAAGLAFALHPVQTEPVNWATGRATLLFSLFYLLAVRLYLAASRRNGPAGLWVLSWGAAAAALLSKEMAITLPAVLALIEWLLPPEPGAAWKRRLARLAPYVVLNLGYLAARVAALGARASREEYWGGSFWKTLMAMGRVVGRYMRLLVFPAGQNLQHVVPIPEGGWDAASAAGFVLVVGVALAAWWVRRRRPALAFGLLWVGVILLPVSNLIPFYGIIAERHLYLAVAGFGLVVGDLLAWRLGLPGPGGAGPAGAASGATSPTPSGGASEAERPRPRPRRLVAAAALALIAAAWAGASLLRSRVWSDEILLWEDTVAKSPSKVKAYTNLGLAYLRRDRPQDAVEQFNKALQIYPDSAAAHAGMGMVHLLRNDPERAAQELRRAVEANPRHLDAHKHLAGAYLRLGRLAEAEKVAQQALQVREEPEIRVLLAAVRFKAGRLEEAEADLRQVLERDPGSAEAMRQMGLLRHRQGRADEAVEFYRRALAVAPAPDLHYNIALIDMGRGDYAAAAAGMARARALAPHIPDLALRQAQAEIARDLKGRVPAEALQALRTEDALGHAEAAGLLRALPDSAAIASRLAPALEMRGAPEVRAGIQATLALLERARGRLGEARARYEGMVQAVESAGARLGAGEMAAQSGDYAAAAEHLRRALELNPSLPQAHARLGFVSGLNGDPASALEHFGRALALAPGYEQALDGRCESLFALARWSEARTCFERRVRQIPEHPQAHYFLAQLYRRMGNAQRAAAEFSRHEEIRARRGAERGETAASPE